MDKPKLTLKRTNSDDADFNSLTLLLDEELWQRYGQEQANYHDSNRIEEIDTVLVIYNNGDAAGCGCFKWFEDGVAELKRMFVTKQYRGRGLSKLLLEELEKWAVEIGYQSLILETGIKQFEAMQLYQKQGYSKIGNFGKYKNMENSKCFSKMLF